MLNILSSIHLNNIYIFNNISLLKIIFIINIVIKRKLCSINCMYIYCNICRYCILNKYNKLFKIYNFHISNFSINYHLYHRHDSYEINIFMNQSLSIIQLNSIYLSSNTFRMNIETEKKLDELFKKYLFLNSIDRLNKKYELLLVRKLFSTFYTRKHFLVNYYRIIGLLYNKYSMVFFLKLINKLMIYKYLYIINNILFDSLNYTNNLNKIYIKILFINIKNIYRIKLINYRIFLSYYLF